jgi:hypothetical protein
VRPIEQRDQQGLDMFDDETTTSKPQAEPESADAADVDAQLSRAAREAVRQPADPRLEASFAKLAGVATDASAPRRTAAPSSSSVPGAASSAEIDELRAAVAASQAAAEQTVRRLERVTWTLVGVVVVLAVVAGLLLIRSVG